MDFDEDRRTIWCGNLSDKVTEELIYELFLQAGPLQRVKLPVGKDGKPMNYAFVTFKHEASVQYGLQLFDGLSLFDRRLNIKPRLRQEYAVKRDSVGVLPIVRSMVLPVPQIDINNLMHLGGQLIGDGHYKSFNDDRGGQRRHQERWDYKNDRSNRSAGRSNHPYHRNRDYGYDDYHSNNGRYDHNRRRRY